MPFDTSCFFTSSARAWDSFKLAAGSPSLSVLPSISSFMVGFSFSQFASCLMKSILSGLMVDLL